MHHDLMQCSSHSMTCHQRCHPIPSTMEMTPSLLQWCRDILIFFITWSISHSINSMMEPLTSIDNLWVNTNDSDERSCAFIDYKSPPHALILAICNFSSTASPTRTLGNSTVLSLNALSSYIWFYSLVFYHTSCDAFDDKNKWMSYPFRS